MAAGPGARRALHGEGRLEVALGTGGYVCLGEDGWLLLAPPRAVMGPLTLAVSGLGGLRAEPGWPARVDGDVMEVGPHRIALSGEPQQARRSTRPVEVLPSYSGKAQQVGGAADRVEVFRTLAGPLPPPLAPGCRALAQGDHDRAVALIAGRGDGLTPAGDDILAGYAGFMANVGTPVALSERAAIRSPPIALAYLRCAERGELPDPALRLLAAVAAGDATAATRRARVLRRWGASSGRALIWGFAAAATAA